MTNTMPKQSRQYWLFKSEPDVFSIDDFERDQRTHWDGVRNYQARNNMRAMKLGDKGFFYHSNEGKEIVGIVEVIREAYPDPTAKKDEHWAAVDIKALEALPKPVTLAAVKQDSKLKDMVLVKVSRLSVQPVSESEFKHICKLGGVKA